LGRLPPAISTLNEAGAFLFAQWRLERFRATHRTQNSELISQRAAHMEI
jgi:hypothetical protein